MAGLVLVSLFLLVIWNNLDPSPPAWDEAQHLLMAQAFADHLRQFDGGPEWWNAFWHLSQRYPPLTYWLGLPFSLGRVFSRSEGQLINLVLLGLLAWATQRLGRLGWNAAVGGVAAALICLYPAITGLAHVYMTDLPLVVMVTLGLGEALHYWLRPGWISGVGLGVALGLVMLTKWNGLLFLIWPLLLIGARLLWRRRWGQIPHLVVMLGITGVICWGWYGANWVFVLSNGLNYTATTHYYIECPAGSLCWWTIYLGLLPEQMSPILCGLPLLVGIPPSPSSGSHDHPEAKTDLRSQPSSLIHQVQTWLQGITEGSEAWVISTYLAGYGIYTLIGIKTVRFTLPLLPLLAVLSAVGICRLVRRISPRCRAGCNRAVVALGILALFWAGRPFTPGVTALAQTLGPERHSQPQAELIRWLNTQAQPQAPQRTLVGVLPNTELISSETLTYLARLQRLPLSFVPLGQSEWPQLEVRLVDRHLNTDGEWGVIGPYGPSKESILEILQTSPQWQAQDPVQVQSIGTLQTFIPKPESVQIHQSQGSISPELIQVRSLGACEISIDHCQTSNSKGAAWEITWEGSVGDLAQTGVWVDLVQDQRVIAQREFAVGEGRLRRDLGEPVQVFHRFSLDPDQDLTPGDYKLVIRWQTDSRDPHSPVHSTTVPVQIDALHALAVPVDPLRATAIAMEKGDLDLLSKYLNLWTTLRYDPSLIDPDLEMRRRLLRGRLQQAKAQNRLEEQILAHTQLGLIAITQLRAQEAQNQFEILTQLQPDHYWNRGYLAFLRILFTQDLTNLQEEIRAILYPFYTDQALCKPSEDGSQTDICRLLKGWNLLPDPS